MKTKERERGDKENGDLGMYWHINEESQYIFMRWAFTPPKKKYEPKFNINFYKEGLNSTAVKC